MIGRLDDWMVGLLDDWMKQGTMAYKAPDQINLFSRS